MQLLEYKIDKKVRAFSTMRGEGPGCYEGFNITHYCGDAPQHIKHCRSELCHELGIDDRHLLLPRQTHDDKVLFVDDEFLELPATEQQHALYGVDAIVTTTASTCIGVSTADCIPVLLYDKERKAVAAIHAGWRGTVAKIVMQCIELMQTRLGSSPADITAVIAPGISVKAFEVGDEVYDAFKESGFEMQSIARRYPTADGKEKWHIDLWEANRQQLLQCGILSKDIQVAGICTFTRHQEFFSARRLGINSGRIFNGIMMV